MKKVLWVGTLLFLLGFSSYANTIWSCPHINIEVDDNELEINDLTAPIEIVKVFNASYSLIYECNGNCPEDITLPNLDEGVYHLDIQSYTSNWQYICEKKQSIIIASEDEPSCADVNMNVNSNELILTGLTAPNKIIKVFDVFYNLMDVCNSNCGSTYTLPNLLAGKYYLDIQFYSADWQFICQKKERIEVNQGSGPCDNSACSGNIVLTNQAELDAFCGCQVVEGNLTIGTSPGNNITSIANLRDIERVNGTVSIQNTALSNLDGLGNLGIIGKDLIISDNPFLANFNGLNNLVIIEGQFSLKNNTNITNLVGLDRLSEIKDLIIQNNKNLSDLSKLGQIARLATLALINNDRVLSLPSITLSNQSLEGLEIRDNKRLKDLDFLNPINFLSGEVIIQRNAALTDCCGLFHILDNDPDFGSHNATFSISDNPFACKNISAILNNCSANEPSCSDIAVSTSFRKIMVSGLTAENVIVKVFDRQYNTLFNCFGDCEDAFQVDNLPIGSYQVYINFYNENWIPICETIITVSLTNAGGTVSFSDRNLPLNSLLAKDFSFAPNPAQAVTFLDVSLLEGSTAQLQLVNQLGQEVWAKKLEQITRQPVKIELTNFQNGLYFLYLKTPNRPIITKKLMVKRMY